MALLTGPGSPLEPEQMEKDYTHTHTHTHNLHHVKFIIPMALIQLEVLSDTVWEGFPAF